MGLPHFPGHQLCQDNDEPLHSESNQSLLVGLSCAVVINEHKETPMLGWSQNLSPAKCRGLNPLAFCFLVQDAPVRTQRITAIGNITVT
eukprot:8188898-Ditylum_brightwellii.AAC.1